MCMVRILPGDRKRHAVRFQVGIQPGRRSLRIAITKENAGDTASIPIIEAILNDEKHMADWLIQHIPQTTEKFLIRSETDGVEAKK